MFKRTKPIDPNAAYSPSSELLEAGAALTAALDGRRALDAAVERCVTERQAASEAHSTATAEVDRIEVALAVEIDEHRATELEVASEAARRRAGEAAAQVERIDRRQAALQVRARDADAQVDTARAAFNAEVVRFGATANTALAVEARDAVQTLITVLSRGHALAATINSLSPLQGFLGEISIPSPSGSEGAIIAASRVERPDGRVDLVAEWRAEPSAAALAEVLAPIAALRRRVAGHTAFVPPRPASKPYVPQNSRTPEEIAADRAADKAASKPVPSTWVARTWSTDSIRGARTRQAAGVEINAVAGIAEAAMTTDAA